MVARLEGARRRLTAEQDARAWHAWHVAALSRAAKLPPLADLLSDRAQDRGKQSQAQQEIAIDQLFLAWGGDPDQLALARENRGAN